MEKVDWENLSSEEHQEIYNKCKESPAYFYNNFVRKEGQRKISDDEFLGSRKQAETSYLKPKVEDKLLFPKTTKECFLIDDYKIGQEIFLCEHSPFKGTSYENEKFVVEAKTDTHLIVHMVGRTSFKSLPLYFKTKEE